MNLREVINENAVAVNVKAQNKDCLLYTSAGGIHLGNIRQAVSHGPYCIDVSSAVETGGRKDRRKMEEMAQVLR